jgi:hypothetical protein
MVAVEKNVLKCLLSSFSEPNPPKPPRNVTLDPFRLGANNTLTQKIYWQLPKSDIPVQKYRISWSLYINGINESLLKETAVVAEPKRHYEIRDLLPNSMYYLQIQAISLFGYKRLKSEPATQLINTTLSQDMLRQLHHHHQKPHSVNTKCAVFIKKCDRLYFSGGDKICQIGQQFIRISDDTEILDPNLGHTRCDDLIFQCRLLFHMKGSFFCETSDGRTIRLF